MFAQALLDSARQKNFEQLAVECSFLERKTVARELLRDRARALPDVAGREIFQGRTGDPEQIVAAMLIKFRVFRRHDRVDQIAWQLVVRHRLPIFDVDLAEDFPISIENYAGRFHLLEFAQVERRGLAFEMRGQDRKVNREAADQNRNNGGRDVELRPAVPWAPKTVTGRRHEVCSWRSQAVGRKESVAKLRCKSNQNPSRRRRKQTPNVQRSTSNVDFKPQHFLFIGRWTLDVGRFLIAD